jgi:MFS family permease
MTRPLVTELTDGLPPDRRFLAMLSLGVAVCMAVLDGSIANVALPTIARELHATPAGSIWVVNSYQLAVTISLLPLASLGDVHGHRRIFCWGLLLYTIASVGCALATTLPQLVAGRVLQGFGGAGIMSVNGALIRFIFPRAQLGRGIGYNVLVVATSSAAGPSVAAAIMAFASWPWLFAIQVPFGVVSLLLSLRFLPRSPLTSHGFDWVSAVMNAVTLGLFIIGLDGIGHGERWPLVVAELGGSVVMGVVFVRRQLTLRAVGGDGGLLPRCGDHWADRAAVLLSVCGRTVAVRDWRADDALAGGSRGGCSDRRAAGRPVFSRHPGWAWVGGDGDWAVGDDADAGDCLVARCGLAAGALRCWLRAVPVAE